MAPILLVAAANDAYAILRLGLPAIYVPFGNDLLGGDMPVYRYQCLEDARF